MTVRAARASILLFAFLALGTTWPQQPVLPPASPSAESGTAVAVNAIALDSGKNPAAGLAASDFTVLEDGRPVIPAGFQEPEASGPGATEVILVIDAVNLNYSAATYVRSEVARFLQGSAGTLALPVSLAVLQETSFTLSDRPSTDKETLLTELKGADTTLRTVGRSAGFYGASERFDISLRALANLAARERTRPGRKQVIWLSPGWAYFSGPRVEISSKGQQALFAETIGLSDALRQAGIILYSIDPRGAADSASSRNEYYKDFLKPVRRASDVSPGNLSLQALAAKSGGLVLFGSNAISGEINACVREAAGLYTFQLPPASDEAPGYHEIKVQLKKPGATVRAPSGYYRTPALSR